MSDAGKKLYRSVKLRKIKLEDLNDEGKRVLKEYMESDSFVSMDNKTRDWDAIMAEGNKTVTERLLNNNNTGTLTEKLMKEKGRNWDSIYNSVAPTTIQPPTLEPKLPTPIQAPSPQGVNKTGKNRITPAMSEKIREAYPSALAGFTNSLSFNVAKRTDPEFYEAKKNESPISYGVGNVAGQAVKYMTAGALSPSLPVVNKIASPFLKTQAADLVIDNIVNTPQTILDGVSDKKSIGEIGKDVLKQNVTDAAFNLAIGGVGEVVKGIKKGLLQKIEMPNVTAAVTPSLTPPPIGPKYLGQYSVKNTAFEKAVKDYNQAIETIQNHFKTNELRANEIPLIKSELGIDLDNLVNNLIKAEKGVNLPELGQKARLGIKAGVIDPPKLKPKEIKPLLNPKDLPKSPTMDLKSVSNGKLLPTLNKGLGEAQGMHKGLLEPKLPQLDTVKPKLELPGLKPIEKPVIKTPELNKLGFTESVAQSDLAVSELKKIIKENPLSYEPITNKETLSLAQQIVDKNFNEAVQIVKSGNSFDNAVESAMAQDIIRRLQNTAKTDAEWRNVFDLMEVVSNKFKTGGQVIQSASMWSRMTPQGILKYTQRVFEQANEALPLNKKIKLAPEFAQQITDAMKRIEASDNILELIKEQSKARNIPISKFANKELQAASPEKLKDIAIAQVLGSIGDKIPVDAARKISSFQAMAHLLNGRTIIRNVLGNTTFFTAELGSTGYATIWDNIISKATGKRTVTLPKLQGALGEGIKRSKESALDIALGIDRTGVMQGKYNVPAGKSFTGGLLAKGERALRYSLNVPDEFAKGMVNKNITNQLESLGGFTKQEIEKIAKEAELYATFQDNSALAEALAASKKMLNKVSTRIGEAVLGKGNRLLTEDFGFGDFLIKYTTVIGNIVTRSVEYSPAGFLKAIALVAEGNRKGALNQRDISMALGRATNGTIMIGMGVLLNRLGLIVSENRDRSKNALALDRSEGLGKNKVNLSAIKRLVNGEDAKPQSGDIFETFAWLNPVAVGFSVGAALDNEMKKQGAERNIVYRAGSVALEEMLDLPTLSVIRQMTYADGAFDALITPVAEGVSGFVPGPVRQLAQATDPIARETYDRNPLERTANRIQSSIPGLRKKLEPKLSPLGKEIKYPSDPFNTLLNPAQTTIYNPSKVTPKLQKLEDLTGETSHYPSSTAPNSFTHNKNKIELTPEEKTKFQRIAGQETERLYDQILKNKYIELLNDVQRKLVIKQLREAKDKAREKAKFAILKQRQDDALAKYAQNK